MPHSVDMQPPRSGFTRHPRPVPPGCLIYTWDGTLRCLVHGPVVFLQHTQQYPLREFCFLSRWLLPRNSNGVPFEAASRNHSLILAGVGVPSWTDETGDVWWAGLLVRDATQQRYTPSFASFFVLKTWFAILLSLNVQLEMEPQRNFTWLCSFSKFVHLSQFPKNAQSISETKCRSTGENMYVRDFRRKGQQLVDTFRIERPHN